MPILYTIIARDKKTILVDQNDVRGDHTSKIFEVLSVLMPNCKEQCQAGQYIFYVINDQNVSYVCMATEDYARRIAFAFLDEIQAEFKNRFDKKIIDTGLAHAFKDIFGAHLKSRMDFYNSPKCDKLWEAQNQIKEAQDVMTRNLDKILKRGFKLEDMITQAVVFKKEAVGIRRSMWWRNWRLKILIAVLVLVVIYIIIGFACGFAFECVSKNKENKSDSNSADDTGNGGNDDPIPEGRFLCYQIRNILDNLGN